MDAKNDFNTNIYSVNNYFILTIFWTTVSLSVCRWRK
jgi:hypothetical protein